MLIPGRRLQADQADQAIRPLREGHPQVSDPPWLG